MKLPNIARFLKKAGHLVSEDAHGNTTYQITPQQMAVEIVLKVYMSEIIVDQGDYYDYYDVLSLPAPGTPKLVVETVDGQRINLADHQIKFPEG